MHKIKKIFKLAKMRPTLLLNIQPNTNLITLEQKSLAKKFVLIQG